MAEAAHAAAYPATDPVITEIVRNGVIAVTGEKKSNRMPFAPRGLNGGGGYGLAIERDPHLVKSDVVQSDVAQSYVSQKSARDDYGVAIKPESLELDLQATENLRAEMAAEQKGGAL